MDTKIWSDILQLATREAKYYCLFLSSKNRKLLSRNPGKSDRRGQLMLLSINPGKSDRRGQLMLLHAGTHSSVFISCINIFIIFNF